MSIQLTGFFRSRLPINADRRAARRFILLLFAILATLAAIFARGGTAEAQDAPSALARLDGISRIVEDEIRAGHLPGAVILVAIEGKVVYRQAFGDRRVVPARKPMTIDTIFDAASLTKVATATAIMQLSEKGLLDVDRPVATYWPAFAGNGKAAITIRELLTHYSGLPPDLPFQPAWSGYAQSMRRIAALAPDEAPGTAFDYSDVDFAVLGELVRRISGLPLDVYCKRRIFDPLGMRDSSFRPSGKLLNRIAPADFEGGTLRWGQVQDPMAYRMGGVAGHAGLFTTADDLSRFAQMLLSGGRAKGRRILDPRSIAAMTAPQSPPGQPALRGFGWDIDSPYSTSLAPAFSPRSFGHTGYTGTLLWIDPETRSYLIILSNRLHPDSAGNVMPLFRHVAALVGAAAAEVARGRRVLTGVDVLEAYGFRGLQGMRIGLITNASGRDGAGRRTADVLFHAPGVHLRALFSPEHGLEGTSNEQVASGTDAATGLPVYSLYGDTLRPTDAMLDGLDALVFDIQDAGARFYTYASTMGYAMEEAARRGIRFIVLDRPNPVNADVVQGPVLDSDLISFTGYMPMPVRHGMTMGELARMFDGEGKLQTRLKVVAMRYYRRDSWYDETGLTWIRPSPNLRSLDETILYPGVALLEGANLSVGRGTDAPFELLGAPWIDGELLARAMQARALPGVAFAAVDFTPSQSAFVDEVCHGVRITVTDRAKLDSPRLGVELLSALWRLFPGRLEIDKTLLMVGSRRTLAAIESGQDPAAIVQSWDAGLEAFRQQRDQYLVY
jgi:uncharacterized protein YbbC (DUF1343 family)/CubicO group peptidase (beta-lactamase class C family)